MTKESVLSRDARDSLFLLRGGAQEKHFGAGRGGGTVKPQGIFGVGRGGAFLKIFGAGAPRGSHFPQGRGGAGQGVHPCWIYCEYTQHLDMLDAASYSTLEYSSLLT